MSASDSSPPLTLIIGCTGCGKGGVGRALARRVGAEIISADSMKVYRRMDIGTAKPDSVLRKQLPHHLIDVVEPAEDFSVAQYLTLAEEAIAAIRVRGRPILVVGGTPFYLKALVEGLFDGPSADPALRGQLLAEARAESSGVLHDRLRQVDPVSAERIHPNDLRRLVRALEVYQLTGQPISALQTQWDRERRKYPCHFIGLRREREDQSRRINQRVHRMLETGLVAEAEALLAEPDPLSTTARQALGYAEIIEHLEKGVPLADAVENIKIHTRRLAKAQRTWFKRFLETDWLDQAPDDDPEKIAEQLLTRRGFPWSPSPK